MDKRDGTALMWHTRGEVDTRLMVVNGRGHRLPIRMPNHGHREHAGGSRMPNPDGLSLDLRWEKAANEGRHAWPMHR